MKCDRDRDRICMNWPFTAFFFENEVLTPLECWMSAEHDSVSALALRLTVVKLCAQMYTRVAVIDFERRAFNVILYNTSVNIVSCPPYTHARENTRLNMEDKLNDALWSLMRSAAMDSMLVSQLGAVTIRSMFCTTVLGSAAARLPRKFWSLWLRVTTIRSFSCTVHVNVNPPCTLTAYYGHCWKGLATEQMKRRTSMKLCGKTHCCP